ncbi:MAG TPA: NADH-quinone oxidoreductase subunit J [Opitutaceae bacterium]|nr:NADH-quinone oxidoreductase subunit J [Opitutaceae bacterium]
MTAVLVIVAVCTLAAAAVAFALRPLVHSALCLVLAWAGVAAFYLWAGAEFLAFAQVLVYVGAISMVVLFAVLLTRRQSGEGDSRVAGAVRRVAAGLAVAALVAGVLGRAVLAVPPASAPVAPPTLGVRQLGGELADGHAAALLAAGALLTVALIGAVVLAAGDAGRLGEVPP